MRVANDRYGGEIKIEERDFEKGTKMKFLHIGSEAIQLLHFTAVVCAVDLFLQYLTTKEHTVLYCLIVLLRCLTMIMKMTLRS